MGLELKTYRGSLGNLSIFRDWQSACAHICDHLLTPPEAFCWAVLVLDEIRELVTGDGAFRLGRSMWRDEGESAQELYDLYASAIEDALRFAERMGWVWQEPFYGDEPPANRPRKALGIFGVVVVFDSQTVKSARIEGKGSAEQIEKGRRVSFEERRTNPLPRVTKKATEKVPRYPETEAEREYYLFKMFKDTARRVRKEMKTAYYKNGGNHSILHDLKKAIPSFEAWRKLKEEVKRP